MARTILTLLLLDLSQLVRFSAGEAEDVVVVVADVVVDEDVPGHTGGLWDGNITAGREMTDMRSQTQILVNN